MTEDKKSEETKQESVIAPAETATDPDKKADLTPEQQLIHDLQSKLSVATTRASIAERERDEVRLQKNAAVEKAVTATERGLEATENALTNAANAAKSSFESAQKDFEEAYDSGDRKKLIDAQIKLNDAQAALRGAEFQQKNFKSWKEKNPNGAAATVDTSEKSRFTKVEQEWIDAHPKFREDSLDGRKFRAAVYAADEEAREKNIKIDSPDYFRHIEGYLSDLGLDGEAKQESDDPPKKNKETEVVSPKKNDKQSSSTAAPPSGSSGGASSPAKKQVFHMTSEHREAAAICFPDLYRTDPGAAEEKYAKKQLEIQELKRQGKM